MIAIHVGRSPVQGQDTAESMHVESSPDRMPGNMLDQQQRTLLANAVASLNTVD